MFDFFSEEGRELQRRVVKGERRTLAVRYSSAEERLLSCKCRIKFIFSAVDNKTSGWIPLFYYSYVAELTILGSFPSFLFNT